MAERSYHHGNLRATLLKETLSILDKKSVAELNLRDVAQKAGVAQSAIYRHFKNKGALLAAVAEQGFDRLTAAAVAAIEKNAKDSVALYHSVATTYVHFALENPQQFRVMFSGQIEKRKEYEMLQKSSERSFLQVVETIRKCQVNGPVAAKHDATLSALALWSMLHGLSTLIIEEQLTIIDSRRGAQLAKALSRLLLNGLRDHK